MLQFIAAFVVAAVIIVLGFFVWKNVLLQVQSKAMQVQNEVLEAYEKRIAQLEELAKEQGTQITEQGQQIAKLEGVIEGKNDTIKAIIEAIADTDRCLVAASCVNRVVPTS